MRIKIKKCSNPILWYNSHIGKYFDVRKVEASVVWVYEPNNEYSLLNWIYLSDLEIISNIE